MRKIAKFKIIGFEISYNDAKGFELSSVLEGEELPERSCMTVYVPYNGQAREVFCKYDCDRLDLIGIEFK
jgi:hypothetical protein